MAVAESVIRNAKTGPLVLGLQMCMALGKEGKGGVEHIVIWHANSPIRKV